MAEFLVRFADAGKECFVEWSSISDREESRPMSEKQLREHIRRRSGSDGLRLLNSRIARCRHRGHSQHSQDSLDSALSCNRAGKDEGRCTIATLTEFYLHCGGKGERPAEDWPPVAGYDLAAEEDECLEGQIEPGDRKWKCLKHGAHPGPHCEACKVEARTECEGDR